MDTSVLVPAIIFGSVVMIVKIVSDSKIRQRMLDVELDENKIRAMLRPMRTADTYNSLKWGIICLVLGGGIFVSSLTNMDKTTTWGLVLVLGGLGFLATFFIEQKMMNEKKQDKTDFNS